MKGADVFVGLSQPNIVNQSMLLSMAKDPIVFAMANPTPEIDYKLACQTRADVIMATEGQITPIKLIIFWASHLSLEVH